MRDGKYSLRRPIVRSIDVRFPYLFVDEGGNQFVRSVSVHLIT